MSRMWSRLVDVWYRWKERSYLPAIAFAVLIFWLSSQSDLSWLGGTVPPNTTPRFDVSMFDKHVLEFLIFGFLLQYGSNKDTLTIVYGFSYSIFNEIHQWFVPHRFFSLWDISADFLGIILGMIIYEYTNKKIHS